MEWNAVIGLGIVTLAAALVVILLLVSRAASRRDRLKGLDRDAVEADRAAERAEQDAQNARQNHREGTDIWTDPGR